ncbi:hypothetical protein B0H19DRAFT_1061276 [Mycena capillaripes]|nr:hypothetical protein B0H19DRAFT_1061276 [Mycena capillaripes]
MASTPLMPGVEQGRSEDADVPVAVSNDVVLFTRRFSHYDLKTREAIWSRIVNLSMPDGHNDPVAYAKFRGSVAEVCRASAARTISDQTLWSTLLLNRNVLSDSIQLVLGRCKEADLRVRIVFSDIRLRRDTTGILPCVDCIVDRIFDLISDTSSRWKSFFLHTEHPGAFKRVRERCRYLDVPLLKSVALSYGYMPGYSEFDPIDEIYDDPLETYGWFEAYCPSLDHLELVSVLFPSDAPNVFRNVTSLDLSSLCDLLWPFYATLFSTAVNLKYLRLADIDQCSIPSSASLYSASLLVLDIGMDGRRFLADLLATLTAPNLSDLTVRDPNFRFDCILDCADILAQLTRFALFGHIFYGSSILLGNALVRLFETTPHLRVLDLHHSLTDVFGAYCDWLYERVALGRPVVRALEALYLRTAEFSSVLDFLIFNGVTDFSDGSHLTLNLSDAVKYTRLLLPIIAMVTI